MHGSEIHSHVCTILEPEILKTISFRLDLGFVSPEDYYFLIGDNKPRCQTKSVM
jgi:hypothetical protein